MERKEKKVFILSVCQQHSRWRERNGPASEKKRGSDFYQVPLPTAILYVTAALSRGCVINNLRAGREVYGVKTGDPPPSITTRDLEVCDSQVVERASSHAFCVERLSTRICTSCWRRRRN